MNNKKGVAKHAIRIFIIISVTIILPLIGSKTVRAWISGEEADALSSASVIADAPSGRFIVLINKKLHDEEALNIWRDFFSGKDIPIIFEDIFCQVAGTDSGAQDMANSLKSRLPENQMKVKREDATLILSKAEFGSFDVIIFSEEMKELYGVESLYEKPDTEVIKIEKGDTR